MVEMSEYLSEMQANLLCRSSMGYTDKPYYRDDVTANGTKVYWYRQLSDVPERFAISLVHEFFDALPIQENVWKEVLVEGEF